MRSLWIGLVLLYSSCVFSDMLQLQKEEIRFGEKPIGALKITPGTLGEFNYRKRLSVEELAFGRQPELEMPMRREDFESNRALIQKYTDFVPSKKKPELPSLGCSKAAHEFNSDVEARAQFIRECLRTSIPADKAMLRPFTTNLVYLSNANPGAPDPCTGLLLSKTKVLTAAHCIPLKAYLSDGSVRDIESIEACSPYISEYCDHAFLTISPAAFDPVPVTLAKPDKDSRLWIPGYAVKDIRGGADFHEPPPLMWENFAHGSCTVEYARSDCFAHMCQVISGYSGAPVVDVDKSISSKRITLVGMHVSSEVGDTGCSQGLPLEEMRSKEVRLNFGVPINSVPIVGGDYATNTSSKSDGVVDRGLRVDP